MKLARRLMLRQSGGDPYWGDVATLIQPAVDAADSSTAITCAKGLTVTRYNALIKTTLGYPAIYFDGNGDYLNVGVNTDVSFLHQCVIPWTADFWIRTTTELDGDLFDTSRGSAANSGIYCGLVGGKVNLQISNAGGAANQIFSTTFNYTLSANTLYHVAITYDHSLPSENGKLFINGTQVATGDKTAKTPSTAAAYGQLYVGAFSASYPTDMLSGYLRAFRLTKAIRWASVFTPPEYPFLTS